MSSISSSSSSTLPLLSWIAIIILSWTTSEAAKQQTKYIEFGRSISKAPPNSGLATIARRVLQNEYTGAPLILAVQEGSGTVVTIDTATISNNYQQPVENNEGGVVAVEEDDSSSVLGEQQQQNLNNGDDTNNYIDPNTLEVEDTTAPQEQQQQQPSAEEEEVGIIDTQIISIQQQQQEEQLDITPIVLDTPPTILSPTTHTPSHSPSHTPSVSPSHNPSHSPSHIPTQSPTVSKLLYVVDSSSMMLYHATTNDDGSDINIANDGRNSVRNMTSNDLKHWEQVTVDWIRTAVYNYILDVTNTNTANATTTDHNNNNDNGGIENNGKVIGLEVDIVLNNYLLNNNNDNNEAVQNVQVDDTPQQRLRRRRKLVDNDASGATSTQQQLDFTTTIQFHLPKEENEMKYNGRDMLSYAFGAIGRQKQYLKLLNAESDDDVGSNLPFVSDEGSNFMNGVEWFTLSIDGQVITEAEEHLAAPAPDGEEVSTLSTNNVASNEENNDKSTNTSLIYILVMVIGAVFVALLMGVYYHRKKRRVLVSKSLEEEDEEEIKSVSTDADMATAVLTATQKHQKRKQQKQNADTDATYIKHLGSNEPSSQQQFNGIEVGPRTTTIHNHNISDTEDTATSHEYDHEEQDEEGEDAIYHSLIVIAPPGKLGLILTNPRNNMPLILRIRDNSILCDKVQVGDLLLSVDEVDCRGMMASEVQELIGSRSDAKERVLVLLREV